MSMELERVCSAGMDPRGRFILSRAVFENFRSFGGTHCVVLPHQCSLAAIGHSESVNSSFFEGLLFVLGAEEHEQFATDLTEMIHTSDTHSGCAYAQVSVHLEQIENRRDVQFAGDGLSPTTYVVSRTLFRSGESRYTVDTSDKSLSDVRALLTSIGFHLPGNLFMFSRRAADQVVAVSPQSGGLRDASILWLLEDRMEWVNLDEKVARASEDLEQLGSALVKQTRLADRAAEWRIHASKATVRAAKWFDVYLDIFRSKSRLLQRRMLDTTAAASAADADVVELTAKLESLEAETRELQVAKDAAVTSLREREVVLLEKNVEIEQQRKTAWASYHEFEQLYTKNVKENQETRERFLQVELAHNACRKALARQVATRERLQFDLPLAKKEVVRLERVVASESARTDEMIKGLTVEALAAFEEYIAAKMELKVLRVRDRCNVATESCSVPVASAGKAEVGRQRPLVQPMPEAAAAEAHVLELRDKVDEMCGRWAVMRWQVLKGNEVQLAAKRLEVEECEEGLKATEEVIERLNAEQAKTSVEMGEMLTKRDEIARERGRLEREAAPVFAQAHSADVDVKESAGEARVLRRGVDVASKDVARFDRARKVIAKDIERRTEEAKRRWADVASLESQLDTLREEWAAETSEEGRALGYGSLPVLDREELLKESIRSLEHHVKTLVATHKKLRPAVEHKKIAKVKRRDAKAQTTKAELDRMAATMETSRNELEELRTRRADMYRDTLQQISLSVGKIYNALVPGGDAKLTQDGIHAPSCGIKFSVRPPGKGWCEAHSLSTEESLPAALALVFALFGYKWFPLFILDDVVAAVDVATATRVISYIKKHFGDTQVIFVGRRDVVGGLVDDVVEIGEVDRSSPITDAGDTTDDGAAVGAVDSSSTVAKKGRCRRSKRRSSVTNQSPSSPKWKVIGAVSPPPGLVVATESSLGAHVGRGAVACRAYSAKERISWYAGTLCEFGPGNTVRSVDGHLSKQRVQEIMSSPELRNYTVRPARTWAVVVDPEECCNVEDLNKRPWCAVNDRARCVETPYVYDKRRNNARFSIDHQRRNISIVAKRPIAEGEEVFVSYGEEFWELCTDTVNVIEDEPEEDLAGSGEESEESEYVGEDGGSA